MKNIIYTLLALLASLSLLSAQGATGLNNNSRLDSHQRGRATINYYGDGKIIKISSRGVYIGREDKKIILLLQIPKNLKKILKVGDTVGAWVRKAPKKAEYEASNGSIRMVEVYGYLQQRPHNSKIRKRNQKKVF